jgi:hypothetical protein
MIVKNTKNCRKVMGVISEMFKTGDLITKDDGNTIREIKDVIKFRGQKKNKYPLILIEFEGTSLMRSSSEFRLATQEEIKKNKIKKMFKI